MASRLRSETAEEHLALEAVVGFDLKHPDAALTRRMLERFYGILVLLEPAFRSALPDTLWQDRGKLELLRADLLALGHTDATLAMLPVCAGAAELAAGPGRALGALYVFEGSTLGGKLMTKALRHVPGWPLGAPSYLDPYGERTGAMWSEFLLSLARHGALQGDDVVAGARATYGLLQDWFVADLEAAA